MDSSQLKTKIQEMKMKIKILKLQAELEMKTKILELKAELVAKHVKLEAEIRKAEKVAHWYDQQEGQSQCSSTSHHSASPKSVTSTSRPESAGSKAVKDGKYGVFGTLIAKLSRSAPHTRSSDSTSNSPGLPGWLTGKSWKAREKIVVFEHFAEAKPAANEGEARITPITFVAGPRAFTLTFESLKLTGCRDRFAAYR
jgi:hypothetical protein